MRIGRKNENQFRNVTNMATFIILIRLQAPMMKKAICQIKKKDMNERIAAVRKTHDEKIKRTIMMIMTTEKAKSKKTRIAVVETAARPRPQNDILMEVQQMPATNNSS